MQAARGLYPDGVAAGREQLSGHGSQPVAAVRAHRASLRRLAARVEDPDDLPDALAKRAERVVKEDGRQALLNVICRNPMGDR